MDVGPKRDLVGRCCQSMGVVLSLVQLLTICVKQHVLFKFMLVYINCIYSWLSNLRLSENIIFIEVGTLHRTILLFTEMWCRAHNTSYTSVIVHFVLGCCIFFRTPLRAVRFKPMY